MRVAYFTNHYPAVSHTFIRREIRAMEALGVSVVRYAIRCGPSIVDPEDRAEFEKTRYLLSDFLSEIVRCIFPLLFLRPIALFRALRAAAVMGWHSDRGLFRHFFYVAEAIILGSWCKRDGVEHLHAHFGTNAAAVAMFASQLTGIPYSFTAHGTEEFERAAYLSLGEKLEAATFAACVSYFGRAQLLRWSAPSQWSKVAVVHCGVDENFLRRPILPIPSAHRFVCVGRFDEHKGQIVLLAAARRLRSAGIDFELVLAGDGPARSAVEDAVRHYGLTDNVRFTGWIPGDRVRAEIEAARALILPSFAENMPVVIMEALALGRPVISTYVSGIPELVTPGRTGWLVPASDEVKLAEAMLEALRATPGELAAMGIEGRSRITNHHSAIVEAGKLKLLFEGKKPVQESYFPAAVSPEAAARSEGRIRLEVEEARS